jgi:hypothetical protein
MGDKTVFVRTPSERKDLNVLQVLIDLGPEVRAPAGLQVDVQIEGLAGIPPSYGLGPLRPPAREKTPALDGPARG